MQAVTLPMSLREFSHEFRTPLTGIMGMAELLALDSLTEEQRSQVNDILKASNQLLKVINCFLMESKVVNIDASVNDERKLIVNYSH